MHALRYACAVIKMMKLINLNAKESDSTAYLEYNFSINPEMKAQKPEFSSEANKICKEANQSARR